MQNMIDTEKENQFIELFADFMIEKSYSERSMYSYYLDKFAKVYAAKLLPKLLECFCYISENNSPKIDLGKYKCVTRIADYKGKISKESTVIAYELIAHNESKDYDIYVTLICNYVGSDLYCTTVHVGKVRIEEPLPDCAYTNKTATNEIATFRFFGEDIEEARAIIQIADLDFFVVNCLQAIIDINDIILQYNETISS
jgi:hypothetical protein